MMNTIDSERGPRTETDVKLIVRTGDAVGAHDRALLMIASLLFIASVAGTIYWCGSMSGGMPMPGGWTMSMAWMRMPGQTRLGAGVSFMGMWMMMIVAMMLPSLLPTQLNYRRSVTGADDTRLGALSLLVSAGYFLVWVLPGALVYPLGILLAAGEMRWPALSRSVPIATGVVLLLAGCVQLTRWKARQLEHCRTPPTPQSANVWSAWRHGLHLGVKCALCCSAFMIILVAMGVMNLSLMAILTVAITVERLASRPKAASRLAGVIIVAASAFVITRALIAY